MKVHIVKDGQESIEGYKRITIRDGNIGFENVSDNECVYILANDILDEFTIEKREECIGSILKKLRLGGTITIGGTDLRLFCKSVINSSLNKDDASVAINNCKSMYSVEDVLSLIRSTGLKVTSVSTNGIHYEITSERR